PDFTLPDQNGDQVSLSDFQGKHVVLYFYPKDMTPGCTTEACDFRDAHENFGELDAVIIGISPDPVERHQTFIKKHNLPIMLLANEDHQVAETYGVWKLKRILARNITELNGQLLLLTKRGYCKRRFAMFASKDMLPKL